MVKNGAVPQIALLATIFLFNLISFLQSGMILFATAPSMGQIGASPEEFSLITALYASVAVFSISQIAVLIQRLGWRDYLLGSTLVFLIGTWICAASVSILPFAAGRILMAAGGSVFMTAARMLVNFIKPPKRIIGVAAFGISLTVGLSSAPFLAGFMVGHEIWSGVFLFLAFLAILPGWLALKYLPADGITGDYVPNNFPVAGRMTLGASTFLILYGLQRFTYDWYGERPQVLTIVSCGLLLAAWFFRLHGCSAQPFLRMEVLRSKRYVTGLTIYALCYTLLGIFNTVLPQLIQRILGVAFEQAGQIETVGLSGAIFARIVKLLTVRKWPDPTKFYILAFLLLALFGWHFSNLDPFAPVWTSVAFWIIPFGAFISLAMATTSLNAFNDFQHDDILFANAQQLKNMAGQVGLALGAGSTNILLQGRGAVHATRLNEADSSALSNLIQQSNLLASIDVFLIVTLIAVAGAFMLAIHRRFN